MNFAHFIITQFNLRNFNEQDDSAHERWVKWTENRIRIFNEYCLPSIAGQTKKKFTWILFFDNSTPEKFEGFISSLSNYPFITVCRTDGFEGFFTNYMDEVLKLVPEDTGWIMTTRIDNDDCLHRDAIRIIQDNFVKKQNWIISLASGYILEASKGKLSHYYYPMSPFITLIEERSASAKGIFQKGHTQWDELRLFISREVFSRNKRKAKFIFKPLWIQVCHGENVSNSFYRGRPVTRSKDLSEFSINLKTSPMSLASLPRYAHYVTWKRYLKALIVKTLSRE